MCLVCLIYNKVMIYTAALTIFVSAVLSCKYVKNDKKIKIFSIAMHNKYKWLFKFFYP